MSKNSDIADIHFHLKKAKAQYQKMARAEYDEKRANLLSVNFLRHLANALNIDPDNKKLQRFLKGVRNSMKSEDRTTFDEKLTEILAIQSSFRDKGIASTSAFEAKASKTAGATAGYIAKEKASKHTFMIKEFHKKTPKNRFDKSQSDAIREFIGGAIYSLLLYDRSSKIALTTSSENPDKLYIRSKFLSDVKSLKDSTGSAGRSHYIDPMYFEPVPRSLDEVEGFEKVIAACHIMGDPDYHAENLMVQNKKTMTKIDHGKAFTCFPENFEDFLFQLAMDFDYFKYSKAIKNGTLSFNLTKYIDSLNQMLNQLTDEQIDLIIDAKIDQLKKAGLEVEGLQLESTMKSQLKAHVNNMRRFSEKLEHMANAPGKDQKYLNGGWLTELSKPMGLSGLFSRFLEFIAKHIDTAFSSPLTRNTANGLRKIATALKEANFNRRLLKAINFAEKSFPEQSEETTKEEDLVLPKKSVIMKQVNLTKDLNPENRHAKIEQQPSKKAINYRKQL